MKLLMCMLAHTYACAYKDTDTWINYLFRRSLINFSSAKSDTFTDAVCRDDRLMSLQSLYLEKASSGLN